LPTHYPGTETEKRALNLFICLMRASGQMLKTHQTVLAPYGLKPSAFGVLEALHHLGPMCQKTLAGKILTTEGNVTQLCAILERRGLIARRRKPSDRRYVDLHLTAAGKALIGDLFSRILEVLIQTTGRLSADEQEQMTTLCKKLGRGIQAPV
jgi:MarR family transcriptional regulator, 2-MHQ and catechol-resistance regulon repressor